MISSKLKSKFEEVIEFENIEWRILEHVIRRNPNILRPIKGIAFEEYLKKILRNRVPELNVVDGIGDSDIDLCINGFKLQLKTPAKKITIAEKFVGVSLHKTHGNEVRPYNLYKKNEKIFDFLVILHPVRGIFIIPFDEIPESKSWPGYLADPVLFDWNHSRLNNWGLLGYNKIDGEALDDRNLANKSDLPFLTSETFLEDHEVIEALCKPQYFRAAVMGLKGNMKEHWFEEKLLSAGYKTEPPQEKYSKFDTCILKRDRTKIRIQVKGTSKNMCNLEKSIIGVEVMGTHGRFPQRGYTRRMFDYVAVVISSNQLPRGNLPAGLHFICIPVVDLPLHYKIGKGKSFKNALWDDVQYSDIIYPVIKLKFSESSGSVQFVPNVESYRTVGKLKIISQESPFRIAGPYLLDTFPKRFDN